MDAEITLFLELGKYIYNGGVTGVMVWIIYDIHTLKHKMAKSIQKQDVVALVDGELALVKQEQVHIKEQLDRIEDKIDDMRNDLYRPISKS